MKKKNTNIRLANNLPETFINKDSDKIESNDDR